LDQALQEFLRVERGGIAARRELVQEHREAELAAAGQQRPAEGGVYTFKWGSHKKKTIAQLFESGEEPLAQYIPYLFACRSRNGAQDSLMELEVALRREGWWERTVPSRSSKGFQILLLKYTTFEFVHYVTFGRIWQHGKYSHGRGSDLLADLGSLNYK
jgi:hypothetical protein